MSYSHMSPAELALVYKEVQTAITVTYAAFGLVAFEMSITLGDEIKYMWGAERKAIVFFFFLGLRYGILLDITSTVLSNLLPIFTDKGCSTLIQFSHAGFFIYQISLGGIFTLRTFAIWRRNWFIFAVLLLIAIAKTVMSALVLTVGIHEKASPSYLRQFTTCFGSGSTERIAFSTGRTAMVLLFDTLVLVLTLFKTVELAYASRRSGFARSYSYYMLRDGILYYLAIDGINVAAVVFRKTNTLGYIFITFQDILSSIMLQRLVLSLKQLTDENDYPSLHTSTAPGVGTMNFAQTVMLGNIGAPLRTHSEEDGDASLSAEEKALRIPPGHVDHIELCPRNNVHVVDIAPGQAL